MNNWKIITAVSLAVALVSYVAIGSDRNLGLLDFIHKLNGSPHRLGRIVSADAGSSNNTTTASPFGIRYGQTIGVQCNLDSAFVAGQDGGVVAANTDMRLTGQVAAGLYQIGHFREISLASDENVVAFFPLDGGAAGCDVYQLK